MPVGRLDPSLCEGRFRRWSAKTDISSQLTLSGPALINRLMCTQLWERRSSTRSTLRSGCVGAKHYDSPYATFRSRLQDNPGPANLHESQLLTNPLLLSPFQLQLGGVRVHALYASSSNAVCPASPPLAGPVVESADPIACTTGAAQPVFARYSGAAPSAAGLAVPPPSIVRHLFAGRD